MTTTPHDDLERSLEALTAGPAETPGLWRRALEQADTARPPARWRVLLSQPLSHRTLLTGLAACILLTLIVAAGLPRLGSSRGGAHPTTDMFEEQKWRGYDYVAPASGEWKLIGAMGDSLGLSSGRVPAAPAITSAPAPSERVLEELISPHSGTESPPASDQPAPADRQVVRKATMELESPDVPAAFAKAAHAVSEARGEYVQDSSLTGEGENARATLTLRIASDRLGAAMNDLRQLGTVKNENTTGEDVTGQAVDLDARLRNEQRVEAELLALLEKRSDAPLKDILELRQSLSSVRESIERLAGQRQHLSRLVSLATVLVIIRAPAHEEKPPAPAGLWTYFSRNISGSWSMGLAFLADTLAALLRIAVGGIIWWTLAGLLAYAALRHHRRTLARGV